MRFLLKQAVKYYLKFWSKTALAIHAPTVIAIAGTTNKTFTKEAVADTLKRMGIEARASINGFNTEFGLPLSILALPSGYGEANAWWPAIRSAPGKALEKPFPKYLILELGISRPGDMDYLLSIIKPDISIITNLTQRYLESFEDIDSFTEEFGKLAEKTEPDGLVIYNNDVERLKSLRNRTSAAVKTFGFSQDSDISAAHDPRSDSVRDIIINHSGNRFQACLTRQGNHHVYAHLVGMLIEDFLKTHDPQKKPKTD